MLDFLYADGRERVWSFDEDSRVESVVVVTLTEVAKATFFRGRVVGPDCDFNDDGAKLEGGCGRLRFRAEEDCGTSSPSSSSSSETPSPSSASSASSSSESPPSASDPISSASASDSNSDAFSSSSTSESLTPSVPNHGASSASVRSSTRSDDNRTRSRVWRISLRDGSFSRSAGSPSYIVTSAGDTPSVSALAAVPEPETAGGTAYRESLPVDQSRRTMRAAAARSSLPPWE
jgi:hypothetical protein